MDKLTTRRNLLKGALGAPVVLTVASPSNLAAASTTCLVRTVNTSPPTYFLDKSSPDVYHRRLKRVYEVTYKESWSGPNKVERCYQYSNGNLYRISDGAPLNAVSISSKVEKGDALALHYVDSSGRDVGWGGSWTKNGGQFTSIGCVNSLLHV